MNAVFPGLSVLSGSILASLHYSTLRLSEQERFALTAPEKRDKQSTGEGGGREREGESGEGGKERKKKEGEEEGRRKSQLIQEGLRTQTHGQASHGWCLSELVCMGEGLAVAQEKQYMGQEAAVVGLGLHLAGQLLDMLTKRVTALQGRREVEEYS